MLHGEGLGYDYFSQKLKVTEHELGGCMKTGI